MKSKVIVIESPSSVTAFASQYPTSLPPYLELALEAHFGGDGWRYPHASLYVLSHWSSRVGGTRHKFNYSLETITSDSRDDVLAYYGRLASGTEFPHPARWEDDRTLVVGDVRVRIFDTMNLPSGTVVRFLVGLDDLGGPAPLPPDDQLRRLLDGRAQTVDDRSLESES